ncbi:unnamed protein product [Caenorhabditis nigoni]
MYYYDMAEIEPWLSFVNLTKECDSLEVYNAIDLRSVGNQNETKYIAYPRKDEDLVMVTIGIGQDVSTEMKLKEMYTRIKFYGVDPSSYINKDIYEKKLGGKYFHYGSSGKLKTRNYGVFLADNIHQKKIDFLWFGLKGHEYRILNQIHSDGPLDRKRVKVCQINVDLYMDQLKDTRKFHDFVWKILEDKRYIVMKSTFVNDHFIRAFLVNVADRECADLFLS